jgi:hypothetical protein
VRNSSAYSTDARAAARASRLVAIGPGLAPLLQIQSRRQAFGYFRRYAQYRMSEGHGLERSVRLEASGLRTFATARHPRALERFDALFDTHLFQGMLLGQHPPWLANRRYRGGSATGTRA